MSRPDLSFEFPDKDMVVEWYCSPPRRRTTYCRGVAYPVRGDDKNRVVNLERGLYNCDWPAIAIACTRRMRYSGTNGPAYTSVRHPALLSHCYEEDAVVGYWSDARHNMPPACCLGPVAASLVQTGRMHPVDAYWFSTGTPPLAYCFPDYYVPHRMDDKLRMFSARQQSYYLQHERLTF